MKWIINKKSEHFAKIITSKITVECRIWEKPQSPKNLKRPIPVYCFFCEVGINRRYTTLYRTGHSVESIIAELKSSAECMLKQVMRRIIKEIER